ncbi:MAG TPA: DUF1801 domain-containing protein [Bacilli bacterium]|nr:DUF1801 domain-containing protein [Bacilli bacterium]
MELFEEFLRKIQDDQNQKRMIDLFSWISNQYPNLEPRIAWNQPIYTDHGTFIIGFSVAKAHMSIAPENAAILRFSDDIRKVGYEHTNEIIRVKWNQPLNYELIQLLIEYNIKDKKNHTSFWR